MKKKNLDSQEAIISDIEKVNEQKDNIKIAYTGIISARRLEKKLNITRIIAFCLAVVSIVFIFLYVEQTKTNYREYINVYNKSLDNVVSVTNLMIESDFDYDTKYREVIADVNVCLQITYLTKMDSEKQKAFNELYYGLIKLPKQVKIYLNEINQSLKLINNNDDKGFEDLRNTINKFDKLDYE
ncbi:MAG: hypothetical protein RR483_00450 [Clostridia bacterium]